MCTFSKVTHFALELNCNWKRCGICAILLILHTSSWVIGSDFPNVTQIPGTLLNGPIAPQQGRTAIIAWHGGRLITVPEAPGSQSGADLLVRSYNISNLNNIGITTYNFRAGGFNAHGYFHSGRYLFIGGFSPAANPWADSFFIEDNGTLGFRGIEASLGLPVSTYNRSGAHSPWGAEMWWSYNDVGGQAFLTVRRTLSQWTHDWQNGGAATGPAVQARWDHLGQTGVVGMPFIVGNILIYASDQTGTGVATYDISNPASPILLDVLKTQNPGGYWPEIYSHYIFFPRRDGEVGTGSKAGFMVVDYSDPSNLRVVANRTLSESSQYVQFQDEYAFTNRYKIDMRTFETTLTLATNGSTLDASQFALPFGNLVATGGYGSSGPGVAIWAHQAAPDTRGPFVSYHIPRSDQTSYSRECPITLLIHETLRSETIVNGSTLIVRPVGGQAIDCWHSFSQGDVLTITPKQILAANTTYEVVLPPGGIKDAAGNGIEGYSFRFSTGSGISGGNRPPEINALNFSVNPLSPGGSTTVTAVASDPDNDLLSYRFDFGDGSAPTAWQTSASAIHSYTRQGHFQILVRVRDPSGAVATKTRTITVVTPIDGTQPIHSSPIVVNSTTRRVFCVNPDSDSVTALHADTMAKLWETPTGKDPRSIAQSADGSLWVACHDADRIDILNPLNGSQIASFSTNYGSAPIGITSTPDGQTLYVTCTGDGTLRRFNGSTRTQSGSIYLGPRPRAIAIVGNGSRALITRFISAEHEGSVYDVSLSGSMSLTRTIRLRRDYTPDGSANGRGIPNYLAGIAITPDNNRAWVVGKKDNTERGAFFDTERPLNQDNTVRALLMVIDLTTNAENVSMRMDIDNSDSPTAVAFSPLGDYAYIALQGNNQLGLIDHLDFIGNSSKTFKIRWGTGRAPQGLASDATTGRIFTHNFMDRNIGVFEAAALYQTGNMNLVKTTIATVAHEKLPANVLKGKQIFYNASDPRMSAEGYISCASCHVDGGHDGRVFDFSDRGEGFRNTITLHGRAGTGHGAVHWSGNFDEIQDFESDIRNGFGGKGFMNDADFNRTNLPLGAAKAGLSADLDALAAYVTSLDGSTYPRSPFRNSDGSSSALALSGEAIFHAQGCASCHNPAAQFIDHKRHNVGTLRASSGKRLHQNLDGIDTPTLLGLHDTPPYFHDGSAVTLDEVFTIAGGELRQAEDGTISGGAAIDEISWIADKQWHNRRFVEFDNNGELVSFSNINGGNGGAGQLELRYCNHYANTTLAITVNGVTQNLTLSPTPNEPNWYPNEWRRARINVNYAAGGNNTVSLRRVSGGVIKLDNVLFSTPVHHALAQPHRKVSSLPQAEQAALKQFLLELDRPESLPDSTAPDMRTTSAFVRILANDAISVTVDGVPATKIGNLWTASIPVTNVDQSVTIIATGSDGTTKFSVYLK